MAAAGLSGVFLLVFFCACVIPTASAGDRDCKAYTDSFGYHEKIKCRSFCCGSCLNRYCCQDTFWRFDEDKQDDCDRFSGMPETVTIASGVAAVVILITLFICCCVCPCCCLYKMCRKPQPVIATTTHTTVVTSNTQGAHYPQQPTVHVPPQSYQGGQYPGYQPIPAQPGYGAQPQGYGVAMAPYQGQPYTPGPPPPYQEAAAPGYSAAPMPYSQAAYAPGQPSYPLQPPAPAQPQPNAPPAQPDYLAQPAYNPAYAPPPPKS